MQRLFAQLRRAAFTRSTTRRVIVFALMPILLTGCNQPLLRLHNAKIKLWNDINTAPTPPLYYKGRTRPLEHYKDHATAIEYPTESCPTDNSVIATDGPMTLNSAQKPGVWDLTLNEAIRIALQNSPIVRDNLSFRSAGNPILNSPDQATSVYDSAIQETGILFGNRGLEAALSDFDTQFITRITWGKDEQVQNSPFLDLGAGAELIDETGTFQSRLQKTFADGSTFALEHDWNYSQNNVPSRLFPSAYTGIAQAEFRRPLLAGSGAEFTRIAGPISENLTGVSGVAQGVMISRINNDITLTRLESDVTNLVKNIEDLYWDLYLFYQNFDAETVAFHDAVRNYNRVKARNDTGQATILQALQSLYDSQIRVDGALADLQDAEGRLRRLIGLQVSDGRFIRPADVPITADFVPDWHICLAEALTHRVELRRQKWNIKSLELQHKAAKNLNRPRFDFVSNYRINGFGDHLLGDNPGTGAANLYQSAYQTLTRGRQTGWNFGFEFALPVGLRLTHSQVRNYELRIAKARKALNVQEMEISHELSQSFRDLERWRKLADANLRLQRTAEERLKATEIRLRNPINGATADAIDLLLRANLELRNARLAQLRSMIEYNKTITDIHFRKGTLLDHNNLHLEEGLWCCEAYPDALRRTYERTYAKPNPELQIKPMPFIHHYGRIPSDTGLATSVVQPGSQPVPQLKTEEDPGDIEDVPEPPRPGESDGPALPESERIDPEIPKPQEPSIPVRQNDPEVEPEVPELRTTRIPVTSTRKLHRGNIQQVSFRQEFPVQPKSKKDRHPKREPNYLPPPPVQTERTNEVPVLWDAD